MLGVIFKDKINAIDQNIFKNYISISIHEDICYFPVSDSNEDEVIELLNMLSCNFPYGGYTPNVW